MFRFEDGEETEENPQEETVPMSDNNENVGEIRNTQEMETNDKTSSMETRVSKYGPRQPKKFVANSTNSNVCPECERIFGCAKNMKRHYDGRPSEVPNPVTP